MLLCVVLLFAICWSPYLIENVLMSFDMLPGVRTGLMKYMRIALWVTFAYSINSFANCDQFFYLTAICSVTSTAVVILLYTASCRKIFDKDSDKLCILELSDAAPGMIVAYRYIYIVFYIASESVSKVAYITTITGIAIITLHYREYFLTYWVLVVNKWDYI